MWACVTTVFYHVCHLCKDEKQWSRWHRTKLCHLRAICFLTDGTFTSLAHSFQFGSSHLTFGHKCGLVVSEWLSENPGAVHLRYEHQFKTVPIQIQRSKFFSVRCQVTHCQDVIWGTCCRLRLWCMSIFFFFLKRNHLKTWLLSEKISWKRFFQLGPILLYSP